MRRVTKNIYLYLNFNASPFVEVKKLHLQDSILQREFLDSLVLNIAPIPMSQ